MVDVFGLTMRYPKCSGEMKSKDLLQQPKEINEFDLSEFEGQEFECSNCGHKVKISSVEPRDENGLEIY